MVVNWTQPTSYVSYNHVTITEQNLSTTINYMLRIIQGNQTTINNITTIVNNLAAAAAPCSYQLGTLHPSVSLEGSMSIGPVMGLLLQIVVDPDTEPELPGNPPYLWNRGWFNIENGDGLIEQKRLTRASMVWISPLMCLANQVNWSLPEGLLVNVTELVAPPPP